eukprot:185866-Karenia_brevis.AAC.1
MSEASKPHPAWPATGRPAQIVCSTNLQLVDGMSIWCGRQQGRNLEHTKLHQMVDKNLSHIT